ncbi:hypothetical protein AAZX31_09G037400 [Glycine max]
MVHLHYSFFLLLPTNSFFVFLSCTRKEKLAALLCWGDFQWRPPSPAVFLIYFYIF